MEQEEGVPFLLGILIAISLSMGLWMGLSWLSWFAFR